MPEIHFAWTPDRSKPDLEVLCVRGLPSPVLRAWAEEAEDSSRWQGLLSVRPEFGGAVSSIGLPSMSGRYFIGGNQELRFVPSFPLQPGLSYRATLRWPGADASDASDKSERILSFVHHKPAPEDMKPTQVLCVHPQAPVLPENLLKFYIEFSGPMSRGHVYDYIQLRDGAGRLVDLPFLELDEELWDPSMTRLTLFIDPGRIKRGVKPLEDIGPALEEGNRYTLEIDRAWRDAQNQPLTSVYRKEFLVQGPDREPPDPLNWSIEAPKPLSHDDLRVRFPEPLDHALAQRLIQVYREDHQPVEGEVWLEEQDTLWRFQPKDNWSSGRYELVVRKIIEDLAGNNIGKPFEVESSSPVPRDLASGSVRVSFEVR